MSKKHQNNPVNLFVGNNYFNTPMTNIFPQATPVVKNLPIDALMSIVQEALDSPYDDDDIINHVDEFGRNMKAEDAKKARVALRAFLLTGGL